VPFPCGGRSANNHRKSPPAATVPQLLRFSQTPHPLHLLPVYYQQLLFTFSSPLAATSCYRAILQFSSSRSLLIHRDSGILPVSQRRVSSRLCPKRLPADSSPTSRHHNPLLRYISTTRERLKLYLASYSFTVGHCRVTIHNHSR
jgi:hypothetical protein